LRLSSPFLSPPYSKATLGAVLSGKHRAWVKHKNSTYCVHNMKHYRAKSSAHCRVSSRKKILGWKWAWHFTHCPPPPPILTVEGVFWCH
jgi:hypothetical protein